MKIRDFIKKIFRAPAVLFRLLGVGIILGANLKEKTALSYFLVSARMKNAFSLDSEGKTRTFHLKRNRQTFSVLLTDNFSDAEILEEIFFKKDYALKKNIADPKVILDLGSNIGFSAIFFKINYPGARIFCFEPEPYNFQRLLGHIQQFKDMVAFPYAICGTEGERMLRLSKTHMKHTLYGAQEGVMSIPVHCITLAQALAMTQTPKIDLLKFDIEGAEQEILEDLSRFENVRHFVGEIHPGALANFHLDRLLTLLRERFMVSLSWRGKKAFIEGHWNN